VLGKWASKAAVFSLAVSPGVSTRQSFPAMFSGLPVSVVPTPKREKGRGAAIQKVQPILAQYLKQAGYRTVAFLPNLYAFPKKFNILKGFAIIDENPMKNKMAQHVLWAAPSQIDSIIAHMSNRENTSPKFLWTHLMEPHDPYVSGPQPVDFGATPSDQYDSAVHFVDSLIDRLIQTVLSPERAGNTFLIITADHGEAFDEHERLHHGMSLFQEELHVPLLVFGPGVEPRRIDGPVSLLDIFPTIIELAGLKPVQGLWGQSLVPVLKSAKLSPRKEAIAQIMPDFKVEQWWSAYYRNNYKLIYNAEYKQKMLFDIAEDPRETADLAASMPKKVDELTGQLIRSLARCGQTADDLGFQEARANPRENP
jgi:arylsulfatase A-like enzyme